MPAPRPNVPRLQSPAQLHAEWLGLLRPEGPFLALPVLTDVTEIREEIEATVVQDARQAAEKAELLRDAEWMTRKLRPAADAVVGAALSTAVRHAPWYADGDDEEDLDDRLSGIADDVDLLMRDLADPSLEDRLRATIDGWLRGGRPVPIRPLHWPLEFPEVMRPAASTPWSATHPSSAASA